MSEIPQILHDAITLAERRRHRWCTVEHLLGVLLNDEEVADIIYSVNGDYPGLGMCLAAYLDSDQIEPSPVPGAVPEADDLLQRTVARVLGHAVGTITRSNATSIDILLAILKIDPAQCVAADILYRAGVTLDLVLELLGQSRRASAEGHRIALADTKPKADPKMVADAKKYLADYATNLNDRARANAIDPVIGRTVETETAIRILMRRRKNNPLLIGEPGVGKTAIAEGIALRLVSGDVPKAFADAEIYNLDMGQVLAGTKYRGEFEERMRQIIKAVSVIPGAVLFIDEIHLLIGAGATSGSAMDASNLLKPALARGELRCLGATTYDEYARHMEKDRALVRRFKTVPVSAPSVDDAKAILMGLRIRYEEFYGVTYTTGAIEAAVDLTNRYLRNAVLPDKAIDVLDEAGARILLSPRPGGIIDVEDIEAEVATIAKIPLQTIKADEGDQILALPEQIGERVFGQDAAIRVITNAIKIGRVGLRDPNKPEGSFLFSGPTGVGKTEVARALADAMGIPLIKYDMSEYMEKHSLSRLIGAPPGYIGHSETAAGSGLLINDIDRNPRCVLLLDEVEKAHPDLFNLLLQVMDDGRLTSGGGKTVDFRNVLLIMTTNAGAVSMAKASIGFIGEPRRNEDTKAINAFFSPEFRGRLDGIVPFQPLAQAQIDAIVRKFLTSVVTAVESRQIAVVFDDAAISFIADKGFDPAKGARTIGHVITEHLKLPLADLILQKEAMSGDTIRVGSSGDALILSVEKPVLPSLEAA